MQAYDARKKDDIVAARKHRRSLFLAVTVTCKELIMRPDGANSFNVTTFTSFEVERCIRVPGPAKQLLSNYTNASIKFLVLLIREKYKKLLKSGEIFKWNKWIADANMMMNNCG